MAWLRNIYTADGPKSYSSRVKLGWLVLLLFAITTIYFYCNYSSRFSIVFQLRGIVEIEAATGSTSFEKAKKGAPRMNRMGAARRSYTKLYQTYCILVSYVVYRLYNISVTLKIISLASQTIRKGGRVW